VIWLFTNITANYGSFAKVFLYWLEFKKHAGIKWVIEKKWPRLIHKTESWALKIATSDFFKF
jgi:hypothetical protein